MVQLGPTHRSMCLKDRSHHNQWGTTMVESILLQCRLILVTSYRLSMILTQWHPTGADFLQLGHTALTRAVGLKPQTITLITCFRVESATVVSDSAQSNVLSWMELAPTVLTLSGVPMRIVPNNWADRVWNADDQVLEFVICCHCLGPTFQFCAERGGSCGDNATAPRHRHRQGWSRAPGIEEGWAMDDDDLDEVTEDWDQSPTTGSSQ